MQGAPACRTTQLTPGKKPGARIPVLTRKCRCRSLTGPRRMSGKPPRRLSGGFLWATFFFAKESREVPMHGAGMQKTERQAIAVQEIAALRSR